MGQILPGFPSEPDQVYTITLENGLDAAGVEIAPSSLRVRLTWRQRTLGWYLGLATTEGVDIVQGERLNAGAALRFYTAESPPGVFLVVGQDGYVQSDLGDALLLIYYAPDEIPPSVVVQRQTLGP